jgi:DNA transposition AAA+ family ATPase
MEQNGRPLGTFIATKEHRRFVEFANAVRKHRYIGLCYGAAGVGKTLSARRYAHWDIAEPLIDKERKDDATQAEILAALTRSRTVFYTPQILGTVRHLHDRLEHLIISVEMLIDDYLHRDVTECRIVESDDLVEMLIFDEAERLSMTALELIRDIFDRTGVGVILIGMPGMEKRLSRYPQFYSRVGFAHHYRPLTGDELSFVLTRHWRAFGLDLDAADFTDTQAIASIARLTGGNFRLLHRLFVQIERIMKINELVVVTDDVVEAARSTLVVGVT